MTFGDPFEDSGVVNESLSLPNNQRQHRASHIQKDVLPYALC